MTTDSDGYHTDMKFKRKVLYLFLCLKGILQKTKFNIEYLLSTREIPREEPEGISLLLS
jgi:hypothetical protein